MPCCWFAHLDIESGRWSQALNPAVLFQEAQTQGGSFVERFRLDFYAVADARGTLEADDAGSLSHEKAG